MKLFVTDDERAIFTRTVRFAPQRKDYEKQFVRMTALEQERIYRLALRITRNKEDAEDARQETMLKVHRKLGEFEGRSSFTTWTSRIAINEALMCLRKRRRVVHMSLEEGMLSAENTLAADDLQSGVEEPDAAYSRKELRDLLTRAIANLRPTQRVTFILRHVAQLSTIDTAKALHISTSAVKARMKQARSALRAYLQNRGLEGRDSADAVACRGGFDSAADRVAALSSKRPAAGTQGSSVCVFGALTDVGAFAGESELAWLIT